MSKSTSPSSLRYKSEGRREKNKARKADKRARSLRRAAEKRDARIES